MLATLFSSLCSESDESAIILSSFECFVFPEINPDCILLGNSKLSLSGCDLSTVEQCSKTLHPEIYFFYKAIEEIDKRNSISMIFEMKDCWRVKGHSVVCKDVQEKPKQVRELAALMSEFCSFFNYKDCEFLPENYFPGFMAGCLRIAPNSFVYSLKIATNDNGYGHVFGAEDYKRLASGFIHSLSILCVNRFRNVG